MVCVVVVCELTCGGVVRVFFTEILVTGWFYSVVFFVVVVAVCDVLTVRRLRVRPKDNPTPCVTDLLIIVFGAWKISGHYSDGHADSCDDVIPPHGLPRPARGPCRVLFIAWSVEPVPSCHKESAFSCWPFLTTHVFGKIFLLPNWQV